MTEAPNPSAAPRPADRDSGELASELTAALRAGAEARVGALIEGTHAADLADVIGFITAEDRRRLLAQLGDNFDPEILAHLEDTVRGEVAGLLGTANLAAAVSELETDDAVDVVEDLDRATRRVVLDAVAPEERRALEASLAYPDDSAGRLMGRDFIAVPEFWTVGQTIDHMREATDLPNEFHEVFVVDPSHHPIGTLPLDRILRSGRPTALAEIVDAAHPVVPGDMDQEEVAFVFQQYDVISAGVIDGGGRLVGVITVDDILDVIDEEAEEDLMRLGGVGESDLHESIVRATRSRFPWLLIDLGTAIAASIVIAFFDTTIEEIVALAVLMPIVASMGGNAGTQTLTITVRALATHELTATNVLPLLNREVAVSLANGAAMALLIGTVAALWFDDMGLGGVLAAAMIINMVVAGLAGMLVPVGLHRAGVDPALAATVFVTTVTDVVGFLAFLGLGA